MIAVTKEMLKTRFKEYNSLYFNKELRIPIFKAFRSGRAFGMYFYRGVNGRLKRKEIWIAKNVDWTEETLREVLVHEMIHYYLDTHGYNPRRHGRRFKTVCKHLKTTYGLEIHIRKINASIIAK